MAARKSAQIARFEIVNATSNTLLSTVESLTEALNYEPFAYPENAEGEVYVINHVIPNGRRKPIVNLAATYSWVEGCWSKENVEPEVKDVEVNERWTQLDLNSEAVSEVATKAEVEVQQLDLSDGLEVAPKSEVDAEGISSRIAETFSQESGISLESSPEVVSEVVSVKAEVLPTVETQSTVEAKVKFTLDLLPEIKVQNVAQVEPSTVSEVLEVESVGLFGLPGIFEFNSALAPAKEACSVSKLDWEVNLKPLKLAETNEVISAKIGQAAVRSDNGRILGIVGARYNPIQNISLFEVLESLVKVGGQSGVRWDRAGELDGGQIVWAGVKLPDWTIGNNDAHSTYILAAQSHDGSMSLKLVPTSVRVICQNTLRMALNGNKKHQIKIRHSKNVAVNLEQARQTLGIVQSIQAQFAQDGEKLIQTKMSDKTFKAFVDSVMRPSTKEEAGTRLENNRAELYAAFNAPENKGYEGTAYAALQAVTAIESHNSARNAESRFFNLTFNPLESQGQKARKFLLDYAQAPVTQQLQYVWQLAA